MYEVADCTTGAFALFRSADGGRTWRRRTLPSGLHDTDGAQVAFASRRVGFLLYTNAGDRGRLYETHDGGREWRRSSLPYAGGLLAANATVDLYDRHEIYSAGSDGTVRRVARGAGSALFDFDDVLYSDETFDKSGSIPRHVIAIEGNRRVRERLPCHAQYSYASVLTGLPDGTLMDVCDTEPGGPDQLHQVYRSSDDGATWHRFRSKVDGLVVDQGAAGSAGGFVSGYRGDLLRLRSIGRHWSVIPGIGGDEGLNGLGFSRMRDGWATEQGGPSRQSGLWLSDDGGQRWHAASKP